MKRIKVEKIPELRQSSEIVITCEVIGLPGLDVENEEDGLFFTVTSQRHDGLSTIAFEDFEGDQICVPCGITIEDKHGLDIASEPRWHFTLHGDQDYVMLLNGKPIIELADYHKDKGSLALHMIHHVRLV